MRNVFAYYAGSISARSGLVAAFLFFVPARLPAQAIATDQDVQALRHEVVELKSRLVELEAKLAAFPARSPAATVNPVGTNLMQPQSSSPAPVVAAQSGPTTDHPPSKPAPFAFGDFTWMNGQSRQKSQPLSNSFATVNLYLDTYYGYSLNQPRDDTIVGSGAVGRNTEWQINNATIGLDTNYKNVLGKITLQTGNQPP